MNKECRYDDGAKHINEGDRLILRTALNKAAQDKLLNLVRGRQQIQHALNREHVGTQYRLEVFVNTSQRHRALVDGFAEDNQFQHLAPSTPMGIRTMWLRQR